MTDDEKKIELAMRVYSLVPKACIELKIQPYDAVEVIAKTMMVLAITSAKAGHEADVVLDVIGLISEVGTDMIIRKREEDGDESSV